MIENNIQKVAHRKGKQQVKKSRAKGGNSYISSIPDKTFGAKYGNPVKLDRTKYLFGSKQLVLSKS